MPKHKTDPKRDLESIADIAATAIRDTNKIICGCQSGSTISKKLYRFSKNVTNTNETANKIITRI